MDKSMKTLVFSCIFMISLFGSSSAQTCNSFTTFSSNRLYSSCSDLSVLNSFLHWNYHSSNGTVDIAYRHTGVTSSRWVAWALNVGGSGMIGAQCLVAFVNSSGVVRAYTSDVTGYGTTLAEGPLSFNVPNISAEFINSNQMIIYATLELPNGQTSFNQVWQDGPLNGNTLGEHATSGDNMKSTGTVDFSVTGASASPTGGAAGNSRQRRRNTHGVLNAISWGTLMPLGVIIARYLRVFKSADPAWFYLHVTCQCSAYIIGIAGWATGLKLGSDSSGVKHTTHGNIGMVLFILATLQVFALLLRPKKDHKYRLYWNIYHHCVGYTVIILSIVNIFEGLDILDPEKKWRKAYIGILIFLGFNAAMLEAFTWYIVIKRKRSGSEKHPVGTNGTNGYGTRSQQAV
uniref:Cytochrome b561 and DOMON domain-containing protein n=1 Tax=Davidia involucrata TaxID=16924 RepID=A0A5B7BDT6_DAVIN